jgi:hypothetical protein
MLLALLPGKGVNQMPKKLYCSLLVCLALLAGLTSCQMAGIDAPGGVGSLAITVNDATAKTLLPPIDMTIASYDVSGTGPNGRTFSQSSTGVSVVVGTLAFGDWTVTVSGKNSGGTVVGRGTGTATVHTGQQTTLAVTVAPLAGTGTISLGVTWVAADVPTPSISAQLLPSTGSPITLAFSMGSGTATVLKASIPVGYYTLSLKLLDNGVLVMGAVEVVRIVAGQTTSGSFDFTQVNLGTGSIAVTITPAASDPIAVTMTGQKASITSGASMTVTAGVPAGVGNVTYVWYVNGESKATGSTASPNFTVGSALAAGFYRLDVTTFTTDGSRAGAASHRFTVG